MTAMVSTLQAQHDLERYLLGHLRALTILRLRALARADWSEARTLARARSRCVRELRDVVPARGQQLLSAA